MGEYNIWDVNKVSLCKVNGELEICIDREGLDNLYFYGEMDELLEQVTNVRGEIIVKELDDDSDGLMESKKS